MPKISVIVPCYNHGEFLPKAIDSVLAQTFSDWEVIIVDDGSNDGTTPAVIEGQAKRDKRISVITHPENKNLPSSRNTGIRQAKGKYIFPLDSDDFIVPTYLEKAYSLAESENADLVYCHLQLFGEKNHIWRYTEPEKVKELMVFRDTIPQSSLYKKSCWEEFAGYNEDMFCYEDWDFWLYFIEADKKFVLLDEVLMHYRVNYDGLYARFHHRHNDLISMMKKHHPNLYRFKNYYFTWNHLKVLLKRYRDFRRKIIQIKWKKNKKVICFLGIVFHKSGKW